MYILAGFLQNIQYEKNLLFSSVLLVSLFTSCEIGKDPTDSTLCHTITQKGKRCKRMVADGGCYFWQYR